MVYCKVLSKYLTGVDEERHDNPIAMAIVMVEEVLYPYLDIHINIKYMHSLCNLSRDRSIASSKTRSPNSVN
jgi:hypothetical protein